MELEDAAEGDDPLTRPFGLHMVELLLTEPVPLDAARVLRAMRARCGGSVESMGEGEGNALHFVHPESIARYSDGIIPIQTVIWPSFEEAALSLEALEKDLQQTWDWDQAEQAARKHRCFLLITDMMAGSFPPVPRLRLFHASVLALLDVVGNKCVALRWRRAQRLIDPAVYHTLDLDDLPRLLDFAINVRMFRISDGRPRQTLMDTMGMTAFGLPDLQCHFAGLNPSEVAHFLRNAAFYLFNNGDIIEDGNTIAGLGQAHLKWVCQHQMSLVEPDREVLDITPHAPYAITPPTYH